MGIHFVYPYAFLLFLLYLLARLGLKQKSEGLYFSRVDILKKVFAKQSSSIFIVEVLLVFSITVALSYPSATVFKTYTQSSSKDVFMLLNIENRESKSLSVKTIEKIKPSKVAIFALLKSFKKVVPLTTEVDLAIQIIKNLRVVDDKKADIFSSMTGSISLKQEERSLLYLVGFEKSSLQKEIEKLHKYIPAVDVVAVNSKSDVEKLNELKKADELIIKERKPYFLYPLFVSIFILLFYIYLQNRIRDND